MNAMYGMTDSTCVACHDVTMLVSMYHQLSWIVASQPSGRTCVVMAILPDLMYSEGTGHQSSE